MTAADSRLRQGDLLIERIATPNDLPGALLHHWRGTAFVPGAKSEDFERLLRDVAGYPHYFAPQVLEARAVQKSHEIQAWIRLRQRHIIAVVLDATCDIAFGQVDAQHGYSISRSTRIDEIDSDGHALAASEEHGFLWRLNTYWSYEERNRGLYLQIESISLTRSIPLGLGWVIGPFVESVPRESLEFTLRSGRNAVLNRKK